MQWHDFLTAICLVLVLEGLLPFLSPRRWREAMQTAARADDSTIRLVGLFSMLLGTFLLYWVRA